MKLYFSEFVNWFCAVLFMATLLSACGEAVEGCMEPQASNFNPEADVDCCCTYFKLTPNIKLKNDKRDTFFLDRSYTDQVNDSFKVLNLQLLGSDWQLRSAINSVWETPDLTIRLKAKNTERQLVRDAFSWNDLSSGTAQGISWINAASYDSIKFNLGIAASLQPLDQTAIEESNHPLTTATLIAGDSLGAFGLTVYRQQSDDTVTYILTELYPVALGGGFSTVHDQDNPIGIVLDMKTLLSGIAFNIQDQTRVKQQLEQNISSAFSLE